MSSRTPFNTVERGSLSQHTVSSSTSSSHANAYLASLLRDANISEPVPVSSSSFSSSASSSSSAHQPLVDDDDHDGHHFGHDDDIDEDALDQEDREYLQLSRKHQVDELLKSIGYRMTPSDYATTSSTSSSSSSSSAASSSSSTSSASAAAMLDARMRNSVRLLDETDKLLRDAALYDHVTDDEDADDHHLDDETTHLEDDDSHSHPADQDFEERDQHIQELIRQERLRQQRLSDAAASAASSSAPSSSPSRSGNYAYSSSSFSSMPSSSYSDLLASIDRPRVPKGAASASSSSAAPNGSVVDKYLSKYEQHDSLTDEEDDEH